MCREFLRFLLHIANGFFPPTPPSSVVYCEQKKNVYMWTRYLWHIHQPQLTGPLMSVLCLVIVHSADVPLTGGGKKVRRRWKNVRESRNLWGRVSWKKNFFLSLPQKWLEIHFTTRWFQSKIVKKRKRTRIQRNAKMLKCLLSIEWSEIASRRKRWKKSSRWRSLSNVNNSILNVKATRAFSRVRLPLFFLPLSWRSFDFPTLLAFNLLEITALTMNERKQRRLEARQRQEEDVRWRNEANNKIYSKLSW